MNKIGKLRAFAKADGYTHFEKVERNFVQFYSIDECEVCGCEVQAANPVKVVATPHEAASAGLIEKRAPDEGGWSDLHGCATCSACCYDENAGKKDANDSDVTVVCNMADIIASHTLNRHI